jgi:NADPH:quinone reductase-like Zn-dependent oxidoreductase
LQELYIVGYALWNYIATPFKGLASGALKPVIDRTFKFDEMVEVDRYLESNGQFEKIAVTV